MFLQLYSMLMNAAETAPTLLELLGYAAIVCVPGGTAILLLLLSYASNKMTDLDALAPLGLMALGALEGLAFACTEYIGVFETVTWWGSLSRCSAVAKTLALALVLVRALPLGPAATLRVPLASALLGFSAFALVYTVLLFAFAFGLVGLACLALFILILIL